ncbi:tetratricopeptide repeat protein [Streptomyces avidinii]|uniref:Anaphase-promoting complex subunit 5 domain-containing protein n=1 Tax=Streptomyces avidinii TaxID=1895 RepID=A0ABS4L3D8_STRAV|nr:tetratricopeptide repeat protein [Streptomyces avidinii]MBP2036174.1 hypothetical protein [Streptomyces avidinii]GGY83465.1 hypothetical protein GCM10010343_05440 [Streptomyces avidinii]
MTTAWRRWADGDARALIEYVQRRRQGENTHGTPADLLGTSMPAPGVGPPLARARSLYEAFAAAGVQYADEPTTSDPGRQTVRPPDQVLSRPRHGTCLDLAVAFAGACLDAGVHPLVIVLSGARPGDPAHALVAVWLDGDWSNRAHRDYRITEEDPDWTTLPADFVDQLAEDGESGGAFLAVDITGVAARADAVDPRRRERQTWDQAVAHGTELLRGAAEDRWKVTLDVGLGYEQTEPHPLPHRPTTDVLAPPYLPVPQDEGHDSGPLRLLWARHDAIRYHPRDELDFLRDWFQAPDPLGPRTRIALLHGVGGAGKTRLAAELAHQLAATNWYTGFLVRDPDSLDRAWLGDVESPLLVVVDYVEDRKSADVINVLRTLRHRTAPTCLLLTARTVSGWWEEEIAVALKEDGHPYVLHDSALQARHPRQTGVYRSALRSFGGSELAALGHQPPPDPNSGRWTTLDLVMLAWLDAQPEDTGKTPDSEEKLYEKILDHEMGYWVRAYQSQIGKPSKRTKAILREAGACLSLVAPTEERLDHTLNAIGELSADAGRRDQIAALFADLLPSAPEDGTLAVRPDPLGSHLAAGVFGADHDLLRRCLGAADTQERLNACVSVSRFSKADGGTTATAVAQVALDTVPDFWRPALAVASTQGGVFVRALERLAAAEGTPLPLAELAATVPSGHSNLRGLALIATEGSQPEDSSDLSESGRASRAVWLNNLSVRQSETGDNAAALASITEAVQIYRGLAERDPETFLPYLAGSLNNLSSRQSELGDHTAALATITEAVEIRRTVGQDNPSRLPDLASALNNLSVQQSNTGDRTGALTSITEAVEIRRTLSRDDSRFLAGLAGSLNNLANQQNDNGDRTGALTSSTEAVKIYRALTRDDPAAFLPDLASALNNLSIQQGATGDRTAALDSCTEAVSIYQALAEGNPGAFLPYLAASLNNVAVQQSNTGDRAGALASSTEGVALYRMLATDNPGAFLPDLAASVNNLSVQQSNTGDRAGALATITEAVQLYRTLAADNPAASLPHLAGSLNNLSIRRGEIGDRAGALATITEAVQLYRRLATENAAAFLPDLASALNNLAVQQGEIGDRAGALATITEAVQLYRTLATENAAAFLPDLASSLNNLAVQQSEAGDRAAALASSIRAVELYRTLPRDNAAAFLPDLASALNNLSIQQRNSGDPAGALATSTEAVQLYRTLANKNPGAFLPNLAGSLNNLSTQQGNTGDPAGALATSTEAVQLYRTLANSNPGAFLPKLASALNNLSTRHTGDPAGALATSTEAVQLYRTLADSNPGAFLPNLAGSLNNLANKQSEKGDHSASLISSTEAVAIRRTLAAENPGAFLPDLAGSLNNLANRQSATGDRASALVTITEAVQLYRALAAENPGAFLPDLAKSLNNLALQQAVVGDRSAAFRSAAEATEIVRGLAQANPTAFLPLLAASLDTLYMNGHESVTEALHISEGVLPVLPSGQQAELLARRAGWRATLGDHAGTVADLLTAIACAEATNDPVDMGLARRAVRGLVSALEQDTSRRHILDQLPSNLPDWSREDLSDEAVELFNKWLSQPSLKGRADLLEHQYPTLAAPETHRVLRLACSLYPEASGLSSLVNLLDLAAEQGLAKVLGDLRRFDTTTALVHDWLATPSWQDDMEYLVRHPDLLNDPLVRALLSQWSGDLASLQHLGILRLGDLLPLPDVYDIVTDPSTANDTAMTFIDEGRPEVLPFLLAAAPDLQEAPFTAPYLLAVLRLFEETTPPSPEPPPAPELITQAAAQGSEVQRGAGAARLRRLAQRRPEHSAALLELADLLVSAVPAAESVRDTR